MDQTIITQNRLQMSITFIRIYFLCNSFRRKRQLHSPALVKHNNGHQCEKGSIYHGRLKSDMRTLWACRLCNTEKRASVQVAQRTWGRHGERWRPALVLPQQTWLCLIPHADCIALASHPLWNRSQDLTLHLKKATTTKMHLSLVSLFFLSNTAVCPHSLQFPLFSSSFQKSTILFLFFFLVFIFMFLDTLSLFKLLFLSAQFSHLWTPPFQAQFY